MILLQSHANKPNNLRREPEKLERMIAWSASKLGVCLSCRDLDLANSWKRFDVRIPSPL